MDSVACYSLLSVGNAIVRVRMSWRLPAAGAVKEERERVTLLVGQRRGGIDQPGDVGIQADLTVVCGMSVVLAALAEAVSELHAQRHAAQATAARAAERLYAAARQAPDPPPHPAPCASTAALLAAVSFPQPAASGRQPSDPRQPSPVHDPRPARGPSAPRSRGSSR